MSTNASDSSPTEAALDNVQIEENPSTTAHAVTQGVPPVPLTEPPITPVPAGDPENWSSKSDLLSSDALWKNTPGSLYHTLRVAFGIDQVKPLLVHTLEDGTYIVSGNLRGRNAGGTGVTLVAGAGLFVMSGTTGEVKRIMEPKTFEAVVEILKTNPGGLKVEDLEPLKSLHASGVHAAPSVEDEGGAAL